MTDNHPVASQHCANCKEPLSGSFCYKCGEKKLVPARDFSLIKFLEQTLDGFTHFDSKFIKSFQYLITKPGFLTAENIGGLRVPYMKPIQIFLIVGVLFFFLLPHASSFFNIPQDMIKGYASNDISENIFHYDLGKTIAEKAEAHHMTPESVMQSIYSKAPDKSKAFLFVMLPFWALGIWALFRKQQPFYVPHLIFAIHSFAFFMILDVVYIRLLLATVTHDYMPGSFFIPLGLIFLAYLYLAVRRVYQRGVADSMLKSFFILLIFFDCIGYL